MRLKLAVSTMAFVLAGCCSTGGGSPVVVETTLTRLELPERPSRVVRLSAGASENTYVTLTPDQIAQAPDARRGVVADEEVRNDCDDDLGEELLGRAELCLGKRLSLGVSRRHGGPTLGHARFYLAGRDRERAKAGNVSLALSAAYGRDQRVEHDDTQDGAYETRTRRSERNYGLILGYRLGKPALLYGGPYYLRTDYRLEHERPDTALQRSSGAAIARGGHVGLGLFAGRYSSWLIEFSRANIEAGGDDKYLDRWSAVYQLDF